MTTRLIGTLIMMHGDDDGTVLPPRIAPTQIVTPPGCAQRRDTRKGDRGLRQSWSADLRDIRYADVPVEVTVDRRDLGGGVKNWEWIKKGVPLRVEIGPRDLEKNAVEVSRRDQDGEGKGVDADERVRRARARDPRLNSEFAISAREGVSRRKHACDRIKKRFLRFLHA